MTSHTDLIKDKLNILDVVGAYVQLEKAGKTYKGKSPFTHEKTPSFFVSPEKGFFYCFSSGKGGDIFSFIQEIERIDFKDALKLLADKAGVSLTAISPEKEQETALGFRVLDDATKRYEVQLRQNKAVVDYLLERGLSKESIVSWRLGFAKDAWQDIYGYLHSRKYSDQILESVGLVSRKDTRLYDRFRSRIMFPLFDAQGRVRGFTGRVFGSDDKGAKYVNSPDTKWYNKSEILYGYHQAKQALSKEDACILVEGQFDVILSQQAGYINTVAISGTGLSDEHIKLIKRFTNNIILALDADAAGIKATRRSVLAAYQHDMQVKIITLEPGKDPADTILSSKEKWGIAIRDAKEYLDYRLALAERDEMSFNEKKSFVEQDLFEFVSYMKSAVVQDRMLQKIALFLGVDVHSVRQDFSSFSPQESISREGKTQETLEKKEVLSGKDRILALLIYLESLGIDIQEYTERFMQCFHIPFEDARGMLDDTLCNMQLFILEREFENKENSYIIEHIDHIFIQEELKLLKEQSMELLSQIRQAESRGESERAREYMKENQMLRKQIETLQAKHQ